MKIFGKRSRGPAENALPGVFVLFEQALTTVGKDRMLFAGYAAWALIPALATFGLTYVSLSSVWQTVSENVVLVLDLLLSVWVQACIVLLALSRTRKDSLNEKDISAQVRKAMPVLIYLFGFSLFCIIAGLYLLFIPGIVAWVWLSFTDIIPVDQQGTTFSQTLRKSVDLSKGKFLRVLWRLLMGEVLFGMLYLLLCIVVLGILFALAGIDPRTLVDTTLLANIDPPAWISLLLTALTLPVLPYAATYKVALYEALKKA